MSTQLELLISKDQKDTEPLYITMHDAASYLKWLRKFVVYIFHSKSKYKDIAFPKLEIWLAKQKYSYNSRAMAVYKSALVFSLAKEFAMNTSPSQFYIDIGFLKTKTEYDLGIIRWFYFTDYLFKNKLLDESQLKALENIPQWRTHVGMVEEIKGRNQKVKACKEYLEKNKKLPDSGELGYWLLKQSIRYQHKCLPIAYEKHLTVDLGKEWRSICSPDPKLNLLLKIWSDEIKVPGIPVFIHNIKVFPAPPKKSESVPKPFFPPLPTGFNVYSPRATPPSGFNVSSPKVKLPYPPKPNFAPGAIPPVHKPSTPPVITNHSSISFPEKYQPPIFAEVIEEKAFDAILLERNEVVLAEVEDEPEEKKSPEKKPLDSVEEKTPEKEKPLGNAEKSPLELEDLTGKNTWKKNLRECSEIYKETGKLPSKVTSPRLGSWLSSYRTRYFRGKLSRDKIRALNESLPGWSKPPIKLSGWEAEFFHHLSKYTETSIIDEETKKWLEEHKNSKNTLLTYKTEMLDYHFPSWKD